jgi:hypothetical protein
MSERKRILHEQLMSEHRRLTNEIADIKAESFELNDEQKRKVQYLESKIRTIAQQLYVLYQD